MTSVLTASRLPVLRAPFLALVGVALVLIVATVHVLDDGYALAVVRGVAAVLAAALAMTTDDPAGEVLAAAPVPRRTRTLARVAVGLAVAAPVWLGAVALARWRFEPTPVAGLALEAVAFATVAVAVGAVLRARGSLAPSWVAGIGVAAGTVVLYILPARYAMAVTQTWGPPWQAAQVRWAAVLVLATAVLALALRDPLAGRERVVTTPSSTGPDRMRLSAEGGRRVPTRPAVTGSSTRGDRPAVAR